jgi:hypothetical protein
MQIYLIFCGMAARREKTRKLARERRPQAATTRKGFSDPAEQAETEEAQMPSTSNPASNAKLSAPRTTKENVLAKHFSRGLAILRPSKFSKASERTAQSFLNFKTEKTGGQTNRSKASTKPATPTRISVPARRSFSCLPPNKIGTGSNKQLYPKQARAFRPAKFMRANRNQVRVELTDILIKLLAKPLNSNRAKNDSAFVAKRAEFNDRLNRADFVVGSHHRNQNRVRTDCLS